MSSGTPSFSALYASQTVSGYYTANASTYRNPHEPGIRKCLGQVLRRAVQREEGFFDEKGGKKELNVLDFAGGGGEASRAVVDILGRNLPDITVRICGADPFTAALFRERTGSRCEEWGFREVLEGCLLDGVTFTEGEDAITPVTITIISFALHLLPQSELAQTLNMLSCSSRYLCVLAPNRNHLSRITDGMGWEVLDVGEEGEAEENGGKRENWCWVREKRDERVGAGLWRSVNF